jgi:hypothetical protein
VSRLCSADDSRSHASTACARPSGCPANYRHAHGLDRRYGLNHQISVGRRGARYSGQFIGRPVRYGLRTEPDGETSSLFERGVILAPVADSVRGSLFIGRKAYHVTASEMSHSDSYNKAQFVLNKYRGWLQYKSQLNGLHNCGIGPHPLDLTGNSWERGIVLAD